MAVNKRNNSWYVNFRHNYARHRLKSPDNSKAGAEAYEALLRSKLARGEEIKSPKADKRKKEREQKFKDFAWNWFETYVKTNNKDSEISRKKYTLRTNLIPFFGETPINTITTQQVEQYKSKKLSEGLSNKTVNNHLTVLSSCMRTAREWLELDKLPKMKLLKTPPLDIDFLSFEESGRLIEHSYGVWRDIILLALNTGLRQGELQGLGWEDINWEKRELTVRHSWSEYKKGLDSPKSNKARHIPLTNEVYEMLLRRKRSYGFVFIDEKGHRFIGKRLNQEISRSCEIGGIRKITCHALRHTFASHLIMKGAPLKAIQELLGHANIQTTMRYAHLSPSSLRTAIDLLDSDMFNFENFGHYLDTSKKERINVLEVKSSAYLNKP